MFDNCSGRVLEEAGIGSDISQPKYRVNPRELRKINFARALRIRNLNTLDYQKHNNDILGLNYLISCHLYDASVAMKLGIYHGFFRATVAGLGSDEQKATLLPQINANQIKGCVAMTEVGHGSNVKKLQTTASYDVATEGFYLHSPDFLAAKCWVGNLGLSSTHATVYAQLILPSGECEGVHAFLVPIRNPASATPFMMFSHYWVPRCSLLARFSSVSPQGDYSSLIPDPGLRFASSLIPLFLGRWCVLGCTWGNLLKATLIAVRYSTQVRLFPYVAAIYVYKTTLYSVTNALSDINNAMAESEDCSELITEWHILMSGFKPLLTWLAVAGVQECREACGGHGYLYASALGEIKEDNDSMVTLEGDNNVLTQQTSKFLTYIYKTHGGPNNGPIHPNVGPSPNNGPIHPNSARIDSPMNSYYYLTQPDERVKLASFQDLNVSNILSIYSFLVRYLIRKTIATYETNLSKGLDKFTAHNESQVYVARTLALVYSERYVIETFWTKLASRETSTPLKLVLTELCLLYSVWSLEKYLPYLYESEYFTSGETVKLIQVWSLEKYLPYLYESEYFTSGETVKLIQDSVLHLCRKLKPNILSLIEVEAPPDFIVNSILGPSSGLVYKELQSAFYQYPATFEIDPEWKAMLGKSNL
ncbi:hypothetical protein M8J76_001083 [Diaphorina citri]|nr:hypothetical protein M8J76_001083 [Diaphorina citri]